MRLSDLEFVIENPSGSYKKFADSLEEYPILGVTYPTHYGYIKGFRSEDSQDLDVFIGNGNIFGEMQVDRHEDGVAYVETKMLFGINQSEYDSIQAIFLPVITEMKKYESSDEFLSKLENFRAT